MPTQKDRREGFRPAEITVVLIRPERPDPTVLEHAYRILASAWKTA